MMRIDHWDAVMLEAIVGSDYSALKPRNLWTLIHKKHTRAMRPPPALSGKPWWALSKLGLIPPKMTPADGWEAHLANGFQNEAASVAGDVKKRCPHCRPSAPPGLGTKAGEIHDPLDPLACQPRLLSTWGI